MICSSHRTAYRYQLWHHRLLSDFDLGELEAAADDAGRCIQICRSVEADWLNPQGAPLMEDRFEDGAVWFASWKAGADYIIRFPEGCSFYIQPSRMRIDCAPVAGVDGASIAHLILDHAIPRLLSLTPGFVVFHASAVLVGDRVLAVLGQSGQGKSTLAASFAAEGYPLLTDDCLVVRWDEGAGQWLAQPSYQSVRLWPDSVRALGIQDSELREFAGYSSKKRTGREVDFRFASEGAPLAGCFVLPQATEPDEIHPAHVGPSQIEPLSVNDAFVALVGAVFRIDPEDAGVNRREFEVLTSLTDSVRFWTLRYERDYGRLPEVRKTMLNAMAADKIR
ncbi:MAG: hypothetical protein ACRD3F_09315 [Acidobacteriaceae bacterium]